MSTSYIPENLNAVALEHSSWVEEMGWHNKTVLESLALAYSEVSETFEELLKNTSEMDLLEEIADIFLRVADLAITEKVDLYQSTLDAYKKRPQHTSGRFMGCPTYLIELSYLMVNMGRLTNAARVRGDSPLPPEFASYMGVVVLSCVQVASALSCSPQALIQIAQNKMAINRGRGTRGRAV